MKYILLFCDDGGPHTGSPERDAMYAEVGKWWEANGSKIRGGEELQPASTATTVRPGGQVTDGPFIEGKESIGGFAIVEVSDLDEALEMAKTWPASPVVEIRPLVEQTG